MPAVPARRRSERLRACSRRNAGGRSEVHISDDDSSLSAAADTQGDSSESEYEDVAPRASRANTTGGRLGGSKGKPPKKRTRRGACVTIASPPATSIILSLPLDVLYEILGLLFPLELAHLAQTNQAFRATLTAPQSTGIWKRARALAYGAPEPSPGISEVRWARVLFGGHRCEGCNTHNVHKRDFILVFRLCAKCKKGRLVHEHQFRARFEGIDRHVLSLLPYTDTGPSGQSPGVKYYAISDIRRMDGLYKRCLEDIELQKPGAQQALADFEAQCAARIQDVLKHAERCREWWAEYEVTRQEEYRARCDLRYQEFARRYRELGYEDIDIQVIHYFIDVFNDRPLPEFVFNRLRRGLELNIKVHHYERLERDKANIVTIRKSYVRRTYNVYRRTLPVKEALRLPPPQVIYMLPAFRSLIYTDFDTPLEQATCDTVGTHLPEYIFAFQTDVQRSLVRAIECARQDTERWKSHMPVPGGPINPSSVLIAFNHWPEISVHASETSLYSYSDIAACVAYCGTKAEYNTRFWVRRCEEVTAQSRRAFTYAQRRAVIVESLLVALALDPTTTTAEELDAADRRLLCDHCKPKASGHSTEECKVYTWRSYVAHHYHNHRPGAREHDIARIRVLKEHESEAVRRAEGRDPALDQPLWSCNHCFCHLDNLDDGEQVIAHVRRMHKIFDPKEDTDYFHAFPPFRQYREPQLYPPIPTGVEYRSLGTRRRSWPSD